MGCWNETCAISNLPIWSGDRVLFVPLVEQLSTGGLHYACAGYKIMLPPIIGEYDEYGCIENLQLTTEQEEVYLEYLNTRKFFIKQDDRYSFSEDANEEDVIKTILSNGISLVSLGHIDSLSDFLEYVRGGDIYEYEKNIFGKEHYWKTSYTFVREDIFLPLQKELNDRKMNDNKSIREKLFERAEVCFEITKQKNFNPNFVIRQTMPQIRDMDFAMPFIIKNNAESVIVSIELMYILNMLRKGLKFNTSGEGSQASELKMHVVLCEAITKVISDYKDKWMDSYDNEDNLLREDGFLR